MLKLLSFALLWGAGSAGWAQGMLPWNTATSVPALAAQSGVELFYVSNYAWSGNHTDYDLARRDADAFLKAHPTTPTYVVLGATQYQTCDDVPLPVIPTGSGTAATISIIGYGSNVSSLLKREGCGSATTTLELPNAPNLTVQGAVYQGFEVDANHLDSAPCGFYGIAQSTFFDLSCGNALPGADHEIEFGDGDASGVDTGLTLYNLKAFDQVGAGKGALLLPSWTGTALSSVKLVSGGSKEYTQQYTRAQFIGLGILSCAELPTLEVNVSDTGQVNFDNLPVTTYGYVTGATVQSSGNCSDTADLYILVQDGVPVTYGMKFTNLQASHIWNLESTASAEFGEGWLTASANNVVIGEHTYTNQTFQVLESGAGNSHVNAYFDGPGWLGSLIYASTGSFVNSIFSWDGGTYVGSAGYGFGASVDNYTKWTISNSQCTDSSPGFVPILTIYGALSASYSLPAAADFHDIESCDGSLALYWPTTVSGN